MRTMFEMQDSLNRVVNEDWISLGREWYRAIWVECAELMDHVGWKWWKHKTPNNEQAFMEMVDIFHFGISDIIQRKGLSEETILDTVKKMESANLIASTGDVSVEVILKSIEKFAAKTVQTESFDMFDFIILMNQFGFSFDKLYLNYVGKNVLNKFRQDNGYKTGEYYKVWNGKEDNEHLQEVLNDIAQVDAAINLPGIVYDVLDGRYSRFLASQVPA